MSEGGRTSFPGSVLAPHAGAEALGTRGPARAGVLVLVNGPLLPLDSQDLADRGHFDPNDREAVPRHPPPRWREGGYVGLSVQAAARAGMPWATRRVRRLRSIQSGHSRCATELTLEGVPEAPGALTDGDREFIDYLARVAVERALAECGTMTGSMRKR